MSPASARPAAADAIRRARAGLPVVVVRGDLEVLVRRRPVRVVAADESQALPEGEGQGDEQQHGRRDHDDLESGHRYLVGVVGVVPMNGSGVFGVRYWGSWPFHLVIGWSCTYAGVRVVAWAFWACARPWATISAVSASVRAFSWSCLACRFCWLATCVARMASLNSFGNS